MSAIRVKRLEDSSYCETCGPSYADGAEVYIDNQLVLDLEPIAHCFDSQNYSTEQIFEAILKHLGHTITYE